MPRRGSERVAELKTLRAELVEHLDRLDFRFTTSAQRSRRWC